MHYKCLEDEVWFLSYTWRIPHTSHRLTESEGQPPDQHWMWSKHQMKSKQWQHLPGFNNLPARLQDHVYNFDLLKIFTRILPVMSLFWTLPNRHISSSISNDYAQQEGASTLEKGFGINLRILVVLFCEFYLFFGSGGCFPPISSGLVQGC